MTNALEIKNSRGHEQGSLHLRAFIPGALGTQFEVGRNPVLADALEKVQDFHERHPDMSIQDICFAMKISMRTTIVAGGMMSIPDDLTSFPSVTQLLRNTVG